MEPSSLARGSLNEGNVHSPGRQPRQETGLPTAFVRPPLPVHVYVHWENEAHVVHPRAPYLPHRNARALE